MKPYGASFQAEGVHWDYLPVEIGKWYYYDEDVLVGPFNTEEMAERARLTDCKNGSCES